MFNKSKDRLIGLDISSTSIKLVELKKVSNRYNLEAYGVEPLPVNAVIDKNISDTEAVGDALLKLLQRVKPSTKVVATAVSGSAVITKTIEMDTRLNDIERETQIRLDADQYIPYPLSEVNMDFEVLEAVEGTTDKVNVLLVASRTENVDQRVEAVSFGGAETKVVDIEAHAIERAYNQLISGMMAMPELTALVDIGHSQTTLYIFEKDRIIYTREQLFGGKQLTEEIQRRYGLSFEEASINKKENNLPDDYQYEVLQPFLDSVVQQITRSLQFFFSSSKFHDVEHILLSGGTAALPGLSELISQKLGNSVSVADPFAGMSKSSKINADLLASDAPSMLAACGLALRSFD